MADQKISELTELAEAPASGDLLPIVDSSASSTKRIKKSNLIPARGIIATTYMGADGWIQSTTGTGSVDFGNNYCRCLTGTTASSEAYTITLRQLDKTKQKYPIEGSAHLYFLKGAASGEGTSTWHWFTSDGGLTTATHIGIKMVKTSGTAKLYTTTGDGATETATEINADYSTDYNIFGFVWTDGEVKFYQNGSLVATHTTNIPSDSTGYMFSQRANANSSGVQNGLDLQYAHIGYGLF